MIESVRTRSDMVVLLAETPFPEGWRVEVLELQRFRYRSKWSVWLYHDEEVISALSTYDPKERIRRFAASAWAEASK